MPKKGEHRSVAVDKGRSSSGREDRKGNDLDGATWTRYSISVWNDIRKNPTEIRFKHPAMFPTSLALRLIECFTTSNDKVILDPFLGSGSTIVAANHAGKSGIGLDVYKDYIALTQQRLNQSLLFGEDTEHKLLNVDARQLSKYIKSNSVNFCVTSPPYWDILNQKRSADGKIQRSYGSNTDDLGSIGDYEDFLSELAKVFYEVFKVLIPGKYCVVNVMDIRKKDTFFPLHSDLSRKMVETGWIFDDLIIWDRRQEYNNLRPLGYPFVFRINKIHEYLLIFKKPKPHR